MSKEIEQLHQEIFKAKAREDEFREKVTEEIRQLKQTLASEKGKTERMKRELAQLKP